MSNEEISCTFSLLDTRRKYSGNHRKYIIENAQNICYSGPVREKIKNREALGFYGHGRRLLAGKMNLQEVDVITLPDGQQAMVSNVPSNVTTKFDVKDDGSVIHTQEILDTETGKIVSGLNSSRVGGFSWACPGKDGGTKRPTVITGFSGFDYVLSPGFNENRGYVLESAMGDTILESVAAVVGDDRRAEALVAGWRMELQEHLDTLEEAIFESQERCLDLESQRDILVKSLKEAQSQAEDNLAKLKTEREHFSSILESIANALPFFIPENVMQEMLEGDFTRARGIFESASTMDYSQFPLKPGKDTGKPLVKRKERPLYGSAAYGWTLKI